MSGGIPCNHSAPVDLEVLERQLGGDWSLYQQDDPLAGRLKCGRCGGKSIQIQIIPPLK